MKRHRAILRERKQVTERADKLKCLMDAGYTQKQAEELLNDIDA
jgi:hypothetical protein